MVSELKTLYQESKDELEKDFFEFLRFQSISAEKEFEGQVLACSKWVKDFLTEAGFTTEVWETEGYPVVFGSWMGAGEDKPTILFYNHYDVQPVDPLNLWDNPPFEPTVKDGEVFARGAADNKGQCIYVLGALRSLLRKHGKLPVNVKIIVEGEEETASAGLSKLLEEKKSALQAEHLVVADVGFLEPSAPAVTIGIRGIVPLRVEVVGSSVDLHSGAYGGIVYNPNHALVEILASLRDKNGKITVPGFYDNVEKLSEEEKAAISLDFDENLVKQAFSATADGGEKDRPPLESAWIRPTLELNGICGGYTGDGSKTVIPSLAFANITCRIVPNQDPERVGQIVKDYIESLAPKGVKVTAKVLAGGGKGIRSSVNSEIVKIAKQAVTEVKGGDCGIMLQGGSVPVIAELQEISESELVLIGFMLPGDNMHAPNEHFGLDRIETGFQVVARMLELLNK